MPKIKNILIFGGVAVALILIYLFFIKKAPDEGPLVTAGTPAMPGMPVSGVGVMGTGTGTIDSDNQAFLTALLGVSTIKLDDSIFKDPAFATLVDSTIILTQDGTEGRSNPFAPLGSDTSSAAAASTAPATTGSTSSTSNTAPAAPIAPLGGSSR